MHGCRNGVVTNVVVNRFTFNEKVARDNKLLQNFQYVVRDAERGEEISAYILRNKELFRPFFVTKVYIVRYKITNRYVSILIIYLNTM